MPGQPGANVAPVRDPGGKSGCRCMDMIGKVHRCTCTETTEEFDKPRNKKNNNLTLAFMIHPRSVLDVWLHSWAERMNWSVLSLQRTIFEV